MRSSPSTRWVRRSRARMLSFARALEMLFSKVSVSPFAASEPSRRRIISVSARAYQTSTWRMRAKSLIARRYEPTVLATRLLRTSSRSPRWRAAIATLAASRLTSHSHGPGRLSSKWFTLKTSERSGVAKNPKFDRWASPQSCTRTPLVGEPARSAAIRAAAPR